FLVSKEQAAAGAAAIRVVPSAGRFPDRRSEALQQGTRLVHPARVPPEIARVVISHRFTRAFARHGISSELLDENGRMHDLGLIPDETVIAPERLQAVGARGEDRAPRDCLELPGG